MRLYHLSFRSNLEGVWKPRSPYSQLPPDTPVTKLKYNDPFAEPTDPRISVAPTIKQCFQAIYPNIKKYFEEKKYPYMEMYVYSPEIKKTLKIVTPDTLTKERMVWDAHITEEHWLTQPVKMVAVAKIKVYNTSDSGCITIDPFNDESYDRGEYGLFKVCPKDVHFEVMEYYGNESSLESVNDAPLYLYHYSKHKLSELKTLKQQNILDKETMDKYELGAKNRHQLYPYHEHISFFLERPPLDIIHELYPKDHPAWSKGTKLFEYLVPVENIKMKHWRLVETGFDMFMLNLYIHNDKYLDKWHKSRSLIKSWMGETGDDVVTLRKAISKNLGKTRKAYLKGDRSASYQYAANIPHLMVYTDHPVKVGEPTKVTIGNKNLMNMEMIDIYDTSNLSLEHKAEGNHQSGVVAFITSEDEPGKMFTLWHRWRNHMSMPSGTIDEGEEPSETLIREMDEELGIKTTVFRPLRVIEHTGMEQDGTIVNYTTHVFHISKFNGQLLNMEPESHDLLGFRGLDHIMFANPDNDVTKYAAEWLATRTKVLGLDLLSAFKEVYSQEAARSFKPIESKDRPGWYISPGYEYFLVNKKGEICNAKTGRKLEGSINDRGYQVVATWDNDKKVKKDYKAHRVVCSAMHGPCPGREYEVGHKNDERADNTPSNIHWTTRADNMARVHR